MKEIKIILNGEEKIIKAESTISDLITQLGLDIKKIAIEKDLEIVAPDQFITTYLKDGSSLEIVHFIGGG